MYEPQVNDYVIWKRPNGDIDEGWVYFKGDPVDNEKREKHERESEQKEIKHDWVFRIAPHRPLVGFISIHEHSSRSA